MAQEVTLSVSWSTIIFSIIAAFASIGAAAIIKPAVFILRDIAAWSIINRFIFNEATRNDIERLERYKHRLENQFKEYGDYCGDDEHITSGWLHGEQVNKDYVDIHNSTKNILSKKSELLKIKIENKEARLSFIIQHLGMKSIKNPIAQLSESLQKHYDDNPANDIKIDYDYAVDEATKITAKDL